MTAGLARGAGVFIERSRTAPVLAGLLTAALSWWVWGFAVDPPVLVQDENAYSLQARLFAAGRWSDPPPPADGFFDQVHVLSHPVRAAKYPPGHALALAPGFLAGVPVAWPLACDFASGALLFALARRASGGPIALATWILWLGARGGLFVRSSFFSEVTTSMLWLAGWWALWNWKERRRPGWLALFGICVGCGAITRPLTAVAFALPAGICALVLAARRRAWGAFAAAVLLGASLLALWPLWNFETTGDARLSPLSLYTRDVLPWDRPGLGLRDEPARLELPPDLRGAFLHGYRELHREHTAANLPWILARRLVEVAKDSWGAAWVPLAAFALLGVVWAPRETRVAFASAALLFLLYLSYAHYADWTIYYVEAYGVLAYAAAVGLGGAVARLSARASGPGRAPARPWLAWVPAAALLAAGAPALFGARERREIATREFRLFAAALDALPPGPAVVFVRYGPEHNPHSSLVVNPPGLATSSRWIVYDRGAENASLLGIAGTRAGFLYDEAAHALRPLETE